MSLVNVLRSGVSGMNAQSNRISTVAENIQNASTTGYKRTSTEFSSLLIDGSGQGDYNSGAVETAIRRLIGQDGPTTSTTSDSDLAISGNGFFVVKDAGGAPFLTRAGNFVVDGPTGNLVNAGGFTLQGYSLANGEPNPVLNGIADLQPINVSRLGLEARPSTEARISGNLSFTAPVLSTVATPTTHVDLSGGLPGNTAVLPVGTSPPSGTTYSFKRTVEANDDKGLPLPLDVYLTRVDEKKWLVSAYDGSNTSAFPADPLMATEIEFANFGQQQTFSGSLTIPGGQFTDFSFSLIQRAATTPPAAADNTPNLSLTDDGHVEFDPFAYSKKSSISVVNNVGQKTNLDFYFKKAGPDMWIVNTYDAANASSYPATPLSHDVLRFDGNGRLSKGGPLSVNVPNGRPMQIDIADLTQLASSTALSGTANGMEPAAMTDMAFGSDGTVYATFADGTRAATYKVPLADVASSDNLTPRAGNVYATTPYSGEVQIGFAGQGSRGTLKSKALEQSNVDVSSELTSMIEAQTIYTASSKIFMTGTELLDAIVNLKR